jgi:hypothetical protein
VGETSAHTAPQTSAHTAPQTSAHTAPQTVLSVESGRLFSCTVWPFGSGRLLGAWSASGQQAGGSTGVSMTHLDRLNACSAGTVAVWALQVMHTHQGQVSVEPPLSQASAGTYSGTHSSMSTHSTMH